MSTWAVLRYSSGRNSLNHISLGRGREPSQRLPVICRKRSAPTAASSRAAWCLCPSVGIEDRIAHRLQPVVQRDQILHLTAHGNGGDLTGSRLSSKFPRDRAEGIPPAGRILLLHAAVKDGGDIDGPLCRHRSVFVCQNALDCRCSRVEGRNIPFFHGAPSPHRWSPRPARWAMTERMIMPPVMMLCI